MQSFIEVRSLEAPAHTSETPPLWGIEYKDRRVSAFLWNDANALLVVGFSNGEVTCGKLVKVSAGNFSLNIFYEFDYHTESLGGFGFYDKMLLLFHFTA